MQTQFIELVLIGALSVPTVYALIKGAPFVPSSMDQVNRMLEAAELNPGDVVYDLGSGDGRLVHTAAKTYQAKAIGLEFSPLVWLWSKFLALFWRSKAQLRFANFWTYPLGDADCLVCYLLPKPMEQFTQHILPKLKPGTIIVSHAFQIPGLKPYKTLPRNRAQKLAPVWIYKK